MNYKQAPLSKFTEPVKRSDVELGARAVSPQAFSTLTEWWDHTARLHVSDPPGGNSTDSLGWPRNARAAAYAPAPTSIKPPSPLGATQRKSAISFFFLRFVSTLPPRPGSLERSCHEISPATPLACSQHRHGAVGVGRSPRRTLHRRARATGSRVLPTRRRAQ